MSVHVTWEVECHWHFMHSWYNIWYVSSLDPYHCGLLNFIWFHERLPYGCGHYLHLCKWVSVYVHATDSRGSPRQSTWCQKEDPIWHVPYM